MKKWFLILAVVTCALASCGRAIPRETLVPVEVPPPTAALLPPAAPTLLPTDTPLPPVEPTATATPEPSPTAADAICVPPGSPAPLITMAFSEYPQAVLDHLNGGATLQGLIETLSAVAIANLPVGVMSGDLTGDGAHDFVVSIYDRASTNIPPAGALLIYVCQGGQYTLALNQPTGAGEGGPRLWYLQDLNADGRADLVDTVTLCGASTCFDTVRVWSWDGAAFANRLKWPVEGGLPYPDVTLAGPDADGRYAVTVTATGLGSAGAGPQRAATWMFYFLPEQDLWHSDGMELAASNFRIHVLNDADAAAQAGDYPQALLLYQRVIHDTTLQDWMNPAKEQADLGAYARFKIYAIYTVRGLSDFSQIALNDLTVSVSEGTPQYVFVEMALAFQRAFTDEGAAAGCAAVQALASASPESALIPFGPQVFGYGNSELTPEIVCPWK